MTGSQREAPVERSYGKHRGKVVDNIDPMQIGRIQVLVPDVQGTTLTSWAVPCAPLAGPGTGLFALPPIGAGVWVEFERGDVDLPIWVGGFWGSAAEVPAMVLALPPGVCGITLQTPLGNGITISDDTGPAGGIVIQTPTGAMISVSDDGIVISNGKGATISLTGPTTDINRGGLTVV